MSSLEQYKIALEMACERIQKMQMVWLGYSDEDLPPLPLRQSDLVTLYLGKAGEQICELAGAKVKEVE